MGKLARHSKKEKKNPNNCTHTRPCPAHCNTIEKEIYKKKKTAAAAAFSIYTH
jgi:hypothetical protein